MGRELRIDIDDGWHHVMNRGVARQAIYRCDADRVEFGRLLGVGHERFGVEVHAYCLMTNHFHLLVHCPAGGLSQYMHLIGSTFVRHVNDRTGRDGPLFRGRFRSIVVQDDRQLLTTTRYIHRNALDLPGLTDVGEYRWSSHRTYLGCRTCPSWMRTDTVLAHFGGDSAAFDAFVAADGPEAIGVAPSTGDLRRLDVAVVMPTVELALDEHADALTSAPQGVARTIVILLAQRLDVAAGGLLLSQLGFADPASVAAASRRAQRRAAAEPALSLIVDRAAQLLGA